MPQIWGLHAFREAWLNPKRHVAEAWLTANAARELEDVIGKAGLRRPVPKIVDIDKFKNLFREGDVHQGACFWGEKLGQPSIEDFLAEAPSRVIVLDHVTDPHNVGAIMRSACAFGFEAIIMQDRNAPPITGTLAKIASGAVEHMPLISVTNVARAIDMLKDNGFFAVGLAEEESVSFTTLPKYEKVALVLGAEGEGVRLGVRKACDICVALPTKPPIQSLNVSAAASAAMMGLSLK